MTGNWHMVVGGAVVLLGSCAVTTVVVVTLLLPRGTDTTMPVYDVAAYSEGTSSMGLYIETRRIELGERDARGVAVDAQDRIYVCGGDSVRIFTPNGESVREFRVGGEAGCLALRGDKVFVGVGDHIEVYSLAGDSLAVWTALGEQGLLTSLSVGENAVFAADFGHRVVWQFDLEGRMKGCIGERGTGDGAVTFVLPSAHFDVCVAGDGQLWVVNPGRLRVEKISEAGRLLSYWGEASMKAEGFCGCCNPTDIALGPGGRFFTSEKGLPRVKVYSGSGDFEGVVAGPESFAEGTVGLDLAVDSAGRVLVLDPGSAAVRIFVRNGE